MRAEPILDKSNWCHVFGASARRNLSKYQYWSYQNSTLAAMFYTCGDSAIRDSKHVYHVTIVIVLLYVYVGHHVTDILSLSLLRGSTLMLDTDGPTEFSATDAMLKILQNSPRD